jgi:hypothetical protein
MGTLLKVILGERGGLFGYNGYRLAVTVLYTSNIGFASGIPSALRELDFAGFRISQFVLEAFPLQ